MRAEQHHAIAGREHSQQRSKQQARGDVEPGERLVENESSWLCISAAANSTRWRMPFENVVIVPLAAVVQLQQPQELWNACLSACARTRPKPPTT